MAPSNEYGAVVAPKLLVAAFVAAVSPPINKFQTVTDSDAKHVGVCNDAKSKDLLESTEKGNEEPLVIICTDQNLDNIRQFER